jgi:hypothetical protein
MHLTGDDSMNKNVEKKNKKSKKKSLSFKKHIALFQLAATVIVGIVTICLMKGISNTTNLLYIKSDIQQKADAVLSLTDELSAYKVLYPNPSEEERERIRVIGNRETDAIFALLNAYEFACYQYLKNSVDKRAFKHLYGDGTLNNLLDDYKGMIRNDKYHSIKKVNEKWR